MANRTLREEMLSWRNEELGAFMLGWFSESTAKKRNASALQVPVLSDNIIRTIRTTGFLDVRNIAVEKALRLAADGNFEASGKTFRRHIEELGNKAITERFAGIGKKFTSGRKPETPGPIRKAIAHLLKKAPRMKNPELWAELSAHPPKGWQFFDNRAGKYIEGPNMAHMVQGRFFNICGEERNKITD